MLSDMQVCLSSSNLIQLLGNSGGHLAQILAAGIFVSKSVCCFHCKLSRMITRISPPLHPHLNQTPVFFHSSFLFPYSWGSREAGRHAFWVLGLWHPHSPHPPPEQVCHSGSPPQALEMEEEEEWEVQADLSWYMAFFFFLILHYLNNNTHTHTKKTYSCQMYYERPVVPFHLNPVCLWEEIQRISCSQKKEYLASVSRVIENAANWFSKSTALEFHVLRSLFELLWSRSPALSGVSEEHALFRCGCIYFSLADTSCILLSAWWTGGGTLSDCVSCRMEAGFLFFFCNRWATAQRPVSGLSRTGCSNSVMLLN